VTLLSEAHCTPQQVATIAGHSLKTVFQILERYLARTSGLAEQAIFKFENSSRTKFANQLQTGGDGGTKANGKACYKAVNKLARPKRFELLTRRFVDC
jgi:hypothetical protein